MHLWSQKGTFRPTIGLGVAVNSVTPEMLQKVWSELDYRIDVCRVTRGGTLSVCDTTWNCMSLCNCSHQFCKNIPVSFDFIITWNQGVFLCSPCISTSGAGEAFHEDKSPTELGVEHSPPSNRCLRMRGALHSSPPSQDFSSQECSTCCCMKYNLLFLYILRPWIMKHSI
jgi:hypothetical protein